MPKIICKPLVDAVGTPRRVLGSMRNLLKKIEEVVPEFRAHFKVFQPVYDAARKGSIWRQGISEELEQITKNMDSATMENDG